jgi:hypothetical protein
VSSHAASHPRRPPAPPAQPARAPHITPRRPELLRALLTGLGLLVVGGVAAMGWAVGSTTAPRESPAWRSVALGPATVAVPADWQPEAAFASGLMGLPDQAVAFATAPGLQAHAVVAIAPAGRSRSADVALERVLGPLGTPRRSQVAGLPAQTYAARPVEGDRVAEATLAPTSAGTVMVVCIAKSAAWTGAAGCAGELRPRSLQVVPGGGLSHSPDNGRSMD